MKLTTKQQKFCENIALKSMNQSDSYRDAYDAGNMTDKQIREEASKLANSPNISQTISELKSSLQEKTLEKFSKSRERLLYEFEELIKSAKTENNIKEIRKCLIEQGKLLGYYESITKLQLKKIEDVDVPARVSREEWEKMYS
ncbi:terminase small subunit [Pseudomonadota bacterium]